MGRSGYWSKNDREELRHCWRRSLAASLAPVSPVRNNIAASVEGRARMAASGRVANGIGQPVRRKEDFRLLTGKGSFGDDLALPGMAHAVIVRSPHAHARVIAIDKQAASASPGVLSLLTGADYLAEGLGPIPHNAGLNGPPDV